MTLENLKQNIAHEKELVNELRVLSAQKVQGKDREMVDKTAASLVSMLRIVNNSIPSLLDNISPLKSLQSESQPKAKGIVSISFEKAGKEKSVAVKEDERKRFVSELSLSSLNLKRLRKVAAKKAEVEFKKPSLFAKISNRFFSPLSNRMAASGNFKNIGEDLRKSNIPILLNTYISMMLFATFLAVIFAFLFFILLLFFKISLEFPFLVPADTITNRLLTNSMICLVIPIIAFLGFYLYPYTEKQGIGKKINQELPFIAIHMSAIAGSGIEPTKIFKIIALSKEYPYTSNEIKKVINQVNVYGYDLLNALRNSARATSSEKLAELFNGFATTISSGGDLSDFLDKRAETLLFDYKLEREKSTKVAETFMDIYISTVIAAPMIMMLLLVLMKVGVTSINISIGTLTILIILVVALINIIFLVVLHFKQPKY